MHKKFDWINNQLQDGATLWYYDDFGYRVIRRVEYSADRIYAIEVLTRNGREWPEPVDISNRSVFGYKPSSVYPHVQWIEDIRVNEQVYSK